jgi:2-dehydropantoate 2-reductase
MRVLILGAGALGSLMGARLHSSGIPVVLYSHNMEHIRAVQKNGLRLHELDGGISVLSPQACADLSKIPWTPELVLTLVKSRDTDAAVRAALPFCSGETLFLTLQNGMGNARLIQDLAGPHRVLAGTTAQGATLVRPGEIRHGGDGPSYVGRPGSAADEAARRTAALLDRAGILCKASDEADRLIWKKLLVNVGINAITALARVPNGWIETDPSARELACGAVREAREVASRAGFDFPESVEGEVLDVAARTRANHSSMYQDLATGKPTEIEAINGAVESLARRYGLAAPINWTLTRLIRLVDATHQQGEADYDQ